MEEIEKTLKKKIKQFEKELQKGNNVDRSSASYHFFSVTIPKIQREIIEKCRKALVKIKDGTFGICEKCGEKISPDRLKELPSSELCFPSKCS